MTACVLLNRRMLLIHRVVDATCGDNFTPLIGFRKCVSFRVLFPLRFYYICTSNWVEYGSTYAISLYWRAPQEVIFWSICNCTRLVYPTIRGTLCLFCCHSRLSIWIKPTFTLHFLSTLVLLIIATRMHSFFFSLWKLRLTQCTQHSYAVMQNKMLE